MSNALRFQGAKIHTDSYKANNSETKTKMNKPLRNLIPFYSVFMSTPISIRRDSQPLDIEILKPGMFAPKTILDTLRFKWLNYLDDDSTLDDNLDEAAQYNTEYTNIGLLAALVFTVWVSFQIQVVNTSKFSTNFGLQMEILYSIIWTLAAGLTLYSTIGSVIMLLAINETANQQECKHFMNLFDIATFGLGRLLPLAFLVLSVMTGAVGTVLWFYCNYNSNYVALAVLITLFILSSFFGLFLFNLVSNLYSAREVGKVINLLPNINIEPKYMNDLFNNYCNISGGIEYLDSSDDFINYIQTHINNDGTIIIDPINDELKVKKKLTFLSIKFAHLYFRERMDNKCKELMYEATGTIPTIPVSP